MEKLSFIPMNLQLFAEDGGASGGVATPQGNDEVNNNETLTGGADGGVTDPAPGADPASQKQVQTPEQNAAFAQMRRDAEQAKREAQQAKQALQQRDAWVAQTYGQQGIHTWDQFQQAIAQQQQQQQAEAMRQREQQLQQQGIDPNLIREILRNDPEYQQLRQTAEAQAEQLRQQQGQQLLDTDFKELNGEYSEVKELKDLFALPNYDQIQKFVEKGYSLLHAYEAANRAEIKKKSAEAAKQKTLNDINGKSHLKTEGDGAGDAADIHIDTETMQMYLNMGMDKKQAQAYHKKLYG